MKLVSPMLYRDHMIEVKHRFQAIDRILGAKKPRTLSSAFDNEFMWLQIRQIVELVAYSAIVADEQRYGALRQEQVNNADYRVDSKPTKVLKHLSKISPHFLPKSLGKMTTQPDGIKHFEASTVTAKLDRMLQIHDLASQHLHATNPFNVVEVNDLKARLKVSRERIACEVRYLKGCLWNHVKIGLEFVPDQSPRTPANPDQAWIVSLGAIDSETIQMLLAEGL